MNKSTKLFLIAVTLVSNLSIAFVCSAEVIIIANPSISETGIAIDDVGKVFLGKKRSLDSGSKVKPVVLKTGTVHDEFLAAYVHKSSSQFSAFWKRKIVDGTGIPPKSFSSESDLVAYVMSEKSAIGYVSSGTDVTGLKTLLVE